MLTIGTDGDYNQNGDALPTTEIIFRRNKNKNKTQLNERPPANAIIMENTNRS